MSRKDCFKRELQATIFTAFWPPKSTVERISAGICFSQAECDALNRANLADVPEPRFPVRGIADYPGMF